MPENVNIFMLFLVSFTETHYICCRKYSRID